MSTHCTFYKTGKRMNSTLRPSADGNTWRVDCNFFEPFDILSPEILLRDEGLGTAGPPNNNHIMDYNYVYIERPVDRYYFINKWERIKGIWHGYTSEDVLASWRSTILETQQYIIRSSIKWNDYIPDTFYGYNFNRYTESANISPTRIEGNPWNNMRGYMDDISWNSQIAHKYLGYINTTSTGYTTYVGGKEKLHSDHGIHFGTLTVAAVNDLSQRSRITDVQTVNPNDYINDLYFLPFEPTINSLDGAYAGDSINRLIAGNAKAYNIGGEQREAADIYVESEIPNTATFPMHPIKPLSFERTVWRFDINNFKSDIDYANSSVYTKYYIQMLPFGMVELDANDLINKPSFLISIETDLITGNAIMYYGSRSVANDTYKVLARSNVRIPVQLVKVENNALAYAQAQTAGIMSAVQSALGLAGASASLGFALGGGKSSDVASGAFDVINSGVNLASTTMQAGLLPPMQYYNSTTGAPGSCLIDSEPTLIVARYNINDRDDARFGRPLCEKLILGSQLTGATGANNYTIKNPGLVVCQGAQIKSGTGIEIGQGILAAERAAIESALNGGVYLE